MGSKTRYPASIWTDGQHGDGEILEGHRLHIKQSVLGIFALLLSEYVNIIGVLKHPIPGSSSNLLKNAYTNKTLNQFVSGRKRNTYNIFYCFNVYYGMGV